MDSYWDQISITMWPAEKTTQAGVRATREISVNADYVTNGLAEAAEHCMVEASNENPGDTAPITNTSAEGNNAEATTNCMVLTEHEMSEEASNIISQLAEAADDFVVGKGHEAYVEISVTDEKDDDDDAESETDPVSGKSCEMSSFDKVKNSKCGKKVRKKLKKVTQKLKVVFSDPLNAQGDCEKSDFAVHFVPKNNENIGKQRSEDEVQQVEAAKEAINESEEVTALSGYKRKYHGHVPWKTPRQESAGSAEPNITTLAEALKFFKLNSDLQKLETSLQDVRKRKKSENHHEIDCRAFDKKILKLCQEHHPDRVKNRGGSEEEIELAQKRQATLNAIRTFFGILSKTLLKNIDVDHMYGFYMNLNVVSLENEKEIKDHVYEVFFKIGFLSEIRQENIIAEIRKFLKASKKCLESYMKGDKVTDFVKYRDLALSHLRACIAGYEKLDAKFKAIEDTCKENTHNLRSPIEKMAHESRKERNFLKQVKYVGNDSLEGMYRFLTPSLEMDDYFVLPFVHYVNVIAMCNAFVQNESMYSHCVNWIKNKLPPDNLGIPHPNDDWVIFSYPYYLVSYYSGNKQHEEMLRKPMGDKLMDKEEIKKEFAKSLSGVLSYLDYKFKIENYAEGSNRNKFMDDFMECMRMRAEFKQKEKVVEDVIERLESKNQEIQDRYEKAMRDSEKVEKRFEKSNEKCTARYNGIPEDILERLKRKNSEIEDRYEKAMKESEKYEKFEESNEKGNVRYEGISEDVSERHERKNEEIKERYEKAMKESEKVERKFEESKEKGNARYEGIPDDVLRAIQLK